MFGDLEFWLLAGIVFVIMDNRCQSLVVTGAVFGNLGFWLFVARAIFGDLVLWRFLWLMGTFSPETSLIYRQPKGNELCHHWLTFHPSSKKNPFASILTEYFSDCSWIKTSFRFVGLGVCYFFLFLGWSWWSSWSCAWSIHRFAREVYFVTRVPSYQPGKLMMSFQVLVTETQKVKKFGRLLFFIGNLKVIFRDP